MQSFKLVLWLVLGTVYAFGWLVIMVLTIGTHKMTPALSAFFVGFFGEMLLIIIGIGLSVNILQTEIIHKRIMESDLIIVLDNKVNELREAVLNGDTRT